MLCNEYGLRFELGPEQLHLKNIYSSKVLYIYCRICRIDVLCLHFFLSLSNEFSCVLTPDTALYGDYVACGAIHWTGLAEKSEPSLPPT